MRKDNWCVTVSALCEKRQLVGDRDTFYVTVTDQLSLLFLSRDNWLVIQILSMLQFLTNCHCSLWEKTIGWWFWYSPCFVVTDQLSLLFVRRENWLVILILSMLQFLTNCRCTLWEETIGLWYWYYLCYSYWPIVTAQYENRQLVGDTDSFYVTVTDQFSLHSVRRDNWLVILILFMLQLLTNCHFAVWEKTFGWRFWYSPCYSYRPIANTICERRQLVGDTDTLHVTVELPTKMSRLFVRRDN